MQQPTQTGNYTAKAHRLEIFATTQQSQFGIHTGLGYDRCGYTMSVVRNTHTRVWCSGVEARCTAVRPGMLIPPPHSDCGNSSSPSRRCARCVCPESASPSNTDRQAANPGPHTACHGFHGRRMHKLSNTTHSTHTLSNRFMVLFYDHVLCVFKSSITRTWLRHQRWSAPLGAGGRSGLGAPCLRVGSVARREGVPHVDRPSVAGLMKPQW